MIESKYTKEFLEELRALPLYRKVQLTQNRIIEWYQHFNGDVCISFSGGKDSTVLLHIARQIFPNIKAVFSNTGLEYPEIQAFVMKQDNVDIVRPKMQFPEVISLYGYPLISKEVAEAIYYARRIVPQADTERERERASSIGDTASWGTAQTRSTNGREREQSQPMDQGASARRAEWRGLDTAISASRSGSGQTGEAHSSLPEGRTWETPTVREIHGYPSRGPQNLSGENPSRTDWKCSEPDRWGDSKKKKLDSASVGTTQTGLLKRIEFQGLRERERESGGVEKTKSQFNKEKWLPLCREAPFAISHYCCQVMKKSPLGIYQRKHHLKPILGTMTEESRIRKQAWLRHGCNAFEGKKQTSQPMSFWTEQDVLNYIRLNHLEIASVYGEIEVLDADHHPVIPVEGFGYFAANGDWVDGYAGCTHHCTGCQRTGCIFCGFGAHMERRPEESRWLRLAKTHPRQYEYCMGGGQWVDNPHYDPTDDGKPDAIGWINWNPKKIWVPSKEGLGLREVFRICNQIYGDNFIIYE